MFPGPPLPLIPNNSCFCNHHNHDNRGLLPSARLPVRLCEQRRPVEERGRGQRRRVPCALCHSGHSYRRTFALVRAQTCGHTEVRRTLMLSGRGGGTVVHNIHCGAADLMDCHSRKNINSSNKGFLLFKCPYKSWPRANTNNILVLFPSSVFDQQAPPTLRYSIQTAFVLF